MVESRKKMLFTPGGEASRKYAYEWMGMLPEEKSIEIEIEGTDRAVLGKSWMDAVGNPCALQFAFRTGFDNINPPGETVYYGKSANGAGHLLCASELTEPVAA